LRVWIASSILPIATPALTAVIAASVVSGSRRAQFQWRLTAEGEAKPGERMPQAKDLAAVLGVNTNTVFKALRLLRDQGLLEIGRGRGIKVAGTPERTEFIERTTELLELGRRNGFRRDDLIALLQSFPN
jgi:GntR family transcriptional regulator